MQAARTTAVLLVGTGVLFYLFSPAARPRGPFDDAIDESRRQNLSRETKERNEALMKMIQDTRKKTTREKLETAYDAAVRTHEIGFPSSRSHDKEEEEE
eukprot:scaffold146_cov265-Pinguiococcus_pyrenoidosus.AAC.9